jgi:hypothetical protein
MKKSNLQTSDEIPLGEEIATAQRVLTALVAEKQDLPASIARASADLDSSEAIKLQRRSDEIDLHLNAARGRLERLKIREDEELLREAEAEELRVGELIEPAKKRLDEAQAAFNQAWRDFEQARVVALNLRSSISERKRRVQGLAREASPSLAPIVRSGWQGPPQRAA